VPPRDGDGINGGDQELVAQIIPLRRTRQHPGSFPRVSEPADEAAPLGERSIWDQPTTELRRPEAPGEARHRLALWQRCRESTWIATTALTAAGLLAAVTVVLVTGVLRGAGHTAPPKVALSTSTGLTATDSITRRASGVSSQSRPRVAHRGRVTHRNSQTHPRPHHSAAAGTRATNAVHVTGGSATTDGYAGGSKVTATATAPPVTGGPIQQPVGNSGAGGVESVVSSSAAGSSSAADQCVPGELGC
jgi:hypothetical protein